MGLKITTFRSRVTHSSDWARQAPLKMVLLGLGLESSGRFCFIPLPICYFFFLLLLPLGLLFSTFLYLTVILRLFCGLSQLLSSELCPHTVWSLAGALRRKTLCALSIRTSERKAGPGIWRNLQSVCVVFIFFISHGLPIVIPLLHRSYHPIKFFSYLM